MILTGQSLSQIYNNITNEINNMTYLSGLVNITPFQTLLQTLNSTSNVDVTSLLTYVVAYAEWVQQQSIINLNNSLNTTLNTTGFGQSAWLVQQAMAFQSGDLLQLNTNTNIPYYSVINTSKQIIKSAFAIENYGGILLKIRGINDKMTDEEIQEFIGYINKVKILGQRISVLNANADIMSIFAIITYNNQLNLTDIQNSVNTAINNYISNLPFGSKFYISKLIDNVMNIDGVVDFNLTTAAVSNDNGISTTFAYDTVYTSLAGYINIDTNNPLTSTISYVAIKQ